MIIKKIELNEVQKGIYFDCEIGNSISYNISATMLLENLDENHLENALKLLVAEQEALRCNIQFTDGIPKLTIHDYIKFDFIKTDLSNEDKKNDEKVNDIVNEEISRSFDLNKGPLFRTRLLKLMSNKYLFIVCTHHIISDGLSMDLFKNKLLDFYNKLDRGEKIPLKKDEGLSEFIENENKKLENGSYSKQKQFWINKMQGAEALALQADYFNTKKDNNIGRQKVFEIPKNMMKNINILARDNEITTFMYFLAAFGVLMNNYTRKEDITLSSPFAYRPSFDLEETIGCFVYMLPIRYNVKGSDKFVNIIKEVSNELVNVYRNIGYPNNLIMRDSSFNISPGSPSIFDISFVYDVYEEVEESTLKAKIIEQDLVTFPGNMMVVLNNMPDKDLIKIQYKPNVFSEEMIDLLGKRFIKLLEILSNNIDTKIEDINLLLEDEEEMILNTFNKSSFFKYEPKNIIEIFNSKVQMYPDRTALISGNIIETYGSFNAKANQLARKILKYKKGKNDVIGIQLERSTDLVIAILATLKAGCAYAPIDISYTPSRKEFIFEDAEISLVITSSNLQYDKNWKVDFIFVDDSKTYTGDDTNPMISLDPYSLAYIEYTSGSTGVPKGVMIENHSLVNTLMDLERRFPVEKDDVYLFKTSFSFDVAGTEIYGWFMGEGALLILEPNGEKNPEVILQAIEDFKVTHINFVPSMFRLFLELFDEKSNLEKLKSLKWIFVGGEAVTPDILEKYNSLNLDIKLENVYGPTECTIWASNYSLQECNIESNIPVGRPLNETRWYVISENNKLQPIGIPGELCLSGVGLARGYLNREELTKEKFIKNPFYKEGIDPKHYEVMYRTGDLARWLPNGTIEFMGRIDFQVKIGGIRLELGEIENALSKHESIIQAVVVAKESKDKSSVLCAYYLSNNEIPVTELREYLSNYLPSYMIPSYFSNKREMPLNSSGKVNRRALIEDTEYLNNQYLHSSQFIDPSSKIEKIIASVWKEVLSISSVGLDDNFFEIGGNSLALINVHNKLKKALNVNFSINVLFQLSTVRLLANNFANNNEAETIDRKNHFKRDDKILNRDVAIIGMAVDVPESNNINDFWENLKNQKESIHFYKDDELINLGIDESLLRSKNYIKAKGRVDDIEYFDPEFFDYSPRDVEMMSPQLRLLYKGAWQAFEDAGYCPDTKDYKVGIFLGGSDDFEWYKNILFGDNAFSDKYQAFTFATNHFLASRLAYKLNVRGPVYSALTGCSTTLVTPHLGCQSLILGECDLALAGGVTVELPNEGGYLYEDGMMFSPDGHCRPFDSKAKGTVFSNGMGLVLLKRLDDALRDGDNIYAVIKGSAVNNDGNQKVGFAAPSIEGQIEVIQQACRVAGIDPETISYVEAHGTGTALGDPIEIESLTKAFATDKKEFCMLGSVKGNVGHTDTAAGVVGLVKVSLSLKNKYIPGTVNYDEPNTKIDFKETPFKVSAEGLDWNKWITDKKLMRAAINSFGVGGTNAHMVLEEAPIGKVSSDADKINLLVFSGKTEKGLTETSKKVLEYASKNSNINISDIAWTLQAGRKSFLYRKSIVVNDELYNNTNEFIKKLESTPINKVTSETNECYFMFPGQGSQYQGMARDLYLSAEKSRFSKIFKYHIDIIFDLLKDEKDELIELIYGTDLPDKIYQTKYSQIALFATEYSIAKALMEIGIKPAGLIGHSIGEVTAAAIAGVWDLKDALEIVKARANIMQTQQPGVMLAIMANWEDIEKILNRDIWLALKNTTNRCVVGGKEETIIEFKNKISLLGIKSMIIKTSHAFHTPMMNQAAEEFKKVISKYKMNAPKLPILSNLTGTWALKEELSTAEYWAKHITNPVNFEENLEQILKAENGIFIEVGAGRTLSTFAMQHKSKNANHKFINLIRHEQEQQDDVEYTNNKLGLLWSLGVNIDWTALKGDDTRNRVSLPTYVFEKIHFPINLNKNKNSNSDLLECATTTSTQNIKVDNKNEFEDAILKAYKEIFGFDTIGLDEDFYGLGGDSLKAVSLSSTIKNLLGIKIEVSDLFNYSTPRSLSNYLYKDCISINNEVTIVPVEDQEYYLLSSAQSRMYALYLLDKKGLAYNLPSATIINGKMDKARVENALLQLMRRHEALRTSFEIRNNKPVQIINKNVEIPITYYEKKITNNDDINNLIKDFIKPFSLEKAPLFRVALVTIDVDKYILLFDVHHIIADGTSVEIITRDFNELYFGKIESDVVQYKDFAIWKNRQLQSDEIMNQKDYWINYIGDDIPILDLATDFDRPKVNNFEGSRLNFSIDNVLSNKVIELAQESKATMFMTLLSAWNILLARYSGQEDIVVGTPVAGRTIEEVKDTVGMFVNMLAMRNKPCNNKTFMDFLVEVKENSLNSFKNQDYQFDDLVEQLNYKRQLNRNPLFDVCFDYQNMELFDLEIENIRFSPYKFETNTASYDLVLTCQENKKENTIDCFIDYSTSLFKKETIERISEHFKTILNCITNNKEITIENIDIVSSKERQLIFNKFNNTHLKIDDSILIQEIFEKNVVSNPDKVALILTDGKEFTYDDLNKKSNQLAWKLIELGIGKDSIVAIMPKRDENIFISLLGVLKSGGAYVPIDPELPKDRIEYMLSECNADILICPEEYKNRIDFNGTIINCSLINIDENSNVNPIKRTSSDGLANIIFTSGTTGRPKGVMINQGSLINFIYDIKNREIFENDDDRVICITTISFDIFGFESIVPLCLGKSIYLSDEKEQLDSSIVANKILEHKVTHILSTVSRIKAFVDNKFFEPALNQLKCILSGGENYPLQLLNDLKKCSKAKIYNMYGPTETTIWSTTKDLTNSNVINIGKSIANTHSYIINSAGKLQPFGVFGELCIGGYGLAHGYLNNPEETNKKFVKLNDLPDKLVYKTGDRACILSNGEIEISGRLDSQLKIRGYRVELNEIEKIVLRNENINQAAVIAFEDKNNNKQLALYYCLKEESLSLGKDNAWLKEWLKDLLPHYMVPAYFVLLDKFPTLHNGKIDKKSLKLPQNNNNLEVVKKNENSTSLEKIILGIWKDILDIKEISIKDNFFDIGGNSLALILVNNKLNELIDDSIPLVQLFEHPTIESLAKSLKVNDKISKNEESCKYDLSKNESRKDIAVIGMACKFPNANNIDEFWEKLVNGKELITNFTNEELIKSGISEKVYNNPNYVKSKAHLDNVEYFDSDFFDYNYKESNMMDPQIRILHQCVWEVLEDGGYDSSRYNGKIGLFAGSSSNVPWMLKFLGSKDDILNTFEAMTLNEKDFTTTKVSYKLNLKGPSMNIQTACSTSLVSIHQAAESLIRGESDMAIAGGVSISYPRKEGYLWHEGMIFAKDGHCRPFSDNATGTVPGNGCGVVLLKALDKAISDGDNIYAVIKGSAINNDGLEKIGYTAPSVIGQKNVIQEAIKKADIKVDEINYIETHGTGTKLGDPIEIEALKQAWNTNKKEFCAIGSVKANIGHLDAAAGVAGFIKAVLVLQKKTIPPIINFNKPNPAINIKNTPFYINTKAKDISNINGRLRAGVSSFGIGGTNAHVILEEAPKLMSGTDNSKSNLLVFSGRTITALNNNCKAILNHIKDNKDINISDVAWTLQTGRKEFEYRKFIVINNEINEKNIDNLINNLPTKVTEKKNQVIFMIPGLENYNNDIFKELYYSYKNSEVGKIFETNVDNVLHIIKDENAIKVKEALSQNKSQNSISKNMYTQLASFSMEYSLVKTLISLGITPNGLLGKGIGEVVALVVSGVMKLEDAINMFETSSEILELEIPGVLVSAMYGNNQLKGMAGYYYKRFSEYYLDKENIPLISDIEEYLNELSNEDPIFIKIGTEDVMTEVIEKINNLLIEKEVITLVTSGKEINGFYNALGKIWCSCTTIDWNKFNNASNRKKIPLPTYVFDKKYHDNDVNLNNLTIQKSNRNDNPKEQDNLILNNKEYIESKLSNIWKEILGCNVVSNEDDFFVLGGNSLTAIMLASQVEKVLKANISVTEIFNNSTFNKMVEFIDKNNSNNTTQDIMPIPKSDYYEVSSAQKRMYAVNEFVEDSVPYNLASVYIVEGIINKEKLQDTFNKLIQRHESFRTSFKMIDGKLLQVVNENIKGKVEFTTSKESDIDYEIKKSIIPFDLEIAPLVRMKVISINEEKHVLIVDMHHIISDQSSIAILLKEFALLYAGQDLSPLTIQYKDFAKWQNNLISSGEINKQIEYWKSEFSGEIQTLDLITDYRRKPERSYSGDNIHFEFGKEFSKKINDFVKEKGITPYMLMLSALNLLLWKYTQQKDLVVGTAIAGRRHASCDSMVGMFVNTLAIRSQIDEKLTINEYLEFIKNKMLKAYENQDCQFEMLVDVLNIQKEVGRNPIFDVILNYINMGTEELEIEGLKLSNWKNTNIDTKFDVTCTIEEKEGGYSADIEYSTALFKEDTIILFGERLINLIETILINPEKMLNEISITTAKEREWLLHDLNNTKTNAPLDKNIIQIFEEYVENNGKNAAIIWKDKNISYRELNSKANELAKLLVKNNIKYGDRVGIILERSPLQIISILGILKCGAIYVPIDSEYPNKRINFVLSDSEAKLVLTTTKYVNRIESNIPYLLMDIEENNLDNTDDKSISFINQPKEASGKDTIYIMYTSGSTGLQKGTIISHKNVIRVVKNTNYIDINSNDKVMQLSNYAFDGSVFDIFGAILNGAALVIVPKTVTLEISELTEFIKKNKVTVFFITSALFNMVVDWDVTALKDVRKLLVGGDVVSVTHARRALEVMGPNHIINGYGPTETTVFACYYPIDKIDNNQSIPIGYALSNTTLYVLDEQGQLVPPNVPGELYIGGDGVAKGYLNRDELTATRFINLPLANNERVYKTGDRVMRLSTGEMIFLGRMDFQIKLRGFRVELGEIENEIGNIEGVNEVAAVARKDKAGSLYISAYYTLNNDLNIEKSNLQPNKIKEIIAEKLPNYMIPSRMKLMDKMPLNINRKVDRKALPIIEDSIDKSSNYCPPTNEIEEEILKKMQLILDNNAIGIKDDFFSSGGESIKAIALAQALSKSGFKVKVNDIFQNPTVQKLALLPEVRKLNNLEKINMTNLKDKKPIVLSTLNENQINNVVSHIINTSYLISDMVTESEIKGQFPLSSIQMAHSKLGSNFSGFTTYIDGAIDEKDIRKILVKVIEDNQLLSCAILDENLKQWTDFDILPIKSMITNNIPYFDISEYDDLIKNQIIKKIYTSILLADYIKGKLPWRLSCLRLSNSKHLVVWGFDHTAFDGMSADIIRHQIETEAANISNYNNVIGIEDEEHKGSQKYEDYVKLLANGPKEITENEIIEHFSLDNWRKINDDFIKNISVVEGKSENSFSISIKLEDDDRYNPWLSAFEFITNLLQQYFNTEQLPIGLISYGRSYINHKYYNCVGEFLDVIPIIASSNFNEPNSQNLLNMCDVKSINFLSLLYDSHLKNKFSKIYNYLENSYLANDNKLNMILYNFQGYIEKEDKNAFNIEDSKAIIENNLARVLITVNYDDENLNFELQSSDGINIEKINNIIEENAAELLEV